MSGVQKLRVDEKHWNIEILQVRVKQIREDASRTNVCGVVQLYNSLYKLTSEALTKARGLRDRLVGLDKVALRKHTIFTWNLKFFLKNQYPKCDAEVPLETGGN